MAANPVRNSAPNLKGRQLMNRYCSLLAILTGAVLSTTSSPGQETNLWTWPQTRLDSFETNVGTVIIRATAPIGTVEAGAGTLSIKCREIASMDVNRSETGLEVTIAEPGSFEDTVLVDFEELDSLLKAADFLEKVDWTITSLPSFNATYTTKGGLRLVAFGSRRTGGIEFAVRCVTTGHQPLRLTRDRLGQLRSLIEQAKARLDSIRKG
jgi:hypothetical protein